jgi:hypothetical protein
LGLTATRLGVTALHALDRLAIYPPQIVVGLAILAWGVWYAVRTNGSQVDHRLPLPAACGALTWTDYYASADPVSNGRITPDQEYPASTGSGDQPGELPVRCHEVYASGSVLSDHDSYLASQDQVLPWLLNDLAGAAYGAATSHDSSSALVCEDDIRRACHHRRRLIDALIAARAATLGAGAALWVVFARWKVARPVSDVMHIFGLPAMHGSVIVRLIFIIACMIVFYAIVGLIPWKIRQNRNYRKFFPTAKRHDDPGSGPHDKDAHSPALPRQRFNEPRQSHLAAG